MSNRASKGSPDMESTFGGMREYLPERQKWKTIAAIAAFTGLAPAASFASSAQLSSFADYLPVWVIVLAGTIITLLFLLVIFKGIAAEKKAKLVTVEQKIILDNIPVGIVHVRGPNIVWANPAFEKMFGLPPGGAVGCPTRAFYVWEEDYRRLGKTGYDTLKKGLSFSMESEAPKKDGSNIWVRITGNAIDPEHPQAGSIWMLEDITSFKKSELALKESEKKYRDFAELLPQVVFETDGEGHIIFINRRAVEVTGYDFDDFTKGLKAFDLLTQEDRDRGMGVFYAKMGGTQLGSNEYTLKRKDGTTFPALVFSVPAVYAGKAGGLMGIMVDITGRKQIEAELALRSQMLLNMAGGVQLTRAADETIIYATPSFETMFGYDPGELTGKHVSVLNAPGSESPNELAESIIRSLRKTGSWSGDLRNIRKDGTPFWCHANISFFNHPAYGDVWVSAHHDVTERIEATEAKKKALEALRESEKNFLTAIAGSSDSININRLADGMYISVNRGFTQLMGYTEEETIGKTSLELNIWANPGDRARLAELLGKFGRAQNFEAQFRKKNGEIKYGLMTATVIELEGVPHIVSITRDISERKEMEDALRASRNRLDYIISSSPTVIYTSNVYGHYEATFISDNVCDILGYEPGEFLADHAFWADRIHPGDAPGVMAGLEAAMKEARVIYSHEYRFRHKNGTYRWIYDQLRITRTADGIPYEVLGHILDVTELKHTEEMLLEKTCQLEELTKNLEDRVQTEIELRYKSEQALIRKSKLADMGEMLGAIAHQWRQPLSALGLIVQNIKDAHLYGQLDGLYLERMVEKSMAQIKHMSATIDDFREFFLPDSKKTDFDAMGSLKNVLSLFSAQLAANRIVFSVVCRMHGHTFKNLQDMGTCPGKMVHGMPNEFEHALLNIINNGREAIVGLSRTGGESLSAPGLITFEFSRTDTGLKLEVGDNGGGVPEEILQHVFEPYFTTKDKAKGMGMGLYMAKVIIEDHMGGSLSVKNGEKGAIFTIELPEPPEKMSGGPQAG